MKLSPEVLPQKVEEDGPEFIENQKMNKLEVNKQNDGVPEETVKCDTDKELDSDAPKIFPRKIRSQKLAPSEGELQNSNGTRTSPSPPQEEVDGHIDNNTDTPIPKSPTKCCEESKKDDMKSIEEGISKIELTAKGPGKQMNGGIVVGTPSAHNQFSYNEHYFNSDMPFLNVQNFPTSYSYHPNDLRTEPVIGGRRKRDDDGQQPLKFSSSDLSQTVGMSHRFPPTCTIEPHLAQQATSIGRSFPCENSDDSLPYPIDNTFQMVPNRSVKRTSTNINPRHMSGGELTVTSQQIPNGNTYDNNFKSEEDVDLAELIMNQGYGIDTTLNDSWIYATDKLTESQNIQASVPGNPTPIIDRDNKQIYNYPTTQPLPSNQHIATNGLMHRNHDSFYDASHGSEGYVSENTLSPYSDIQNSPSGSLIQDSPVCSPQSISNLNSPPPTNMSLQSEDSGIVGSPINMCEQEKQEEYKSPFIDENQEILTDVLKTLNEDLSTGKKKTLLNPECQITKNEIQVNSLPPEVLAATTPPTNTREVMINSVPQAVNAAPVTVGGSAPTSNVQISTTLSKPVVLAPLGRQLILVQCPQPQQQTVLVPVVNKASNKKQQQMKNGPRTPREIRPKPMANPSEPVSTNSSKLHPAEIRNTSVSSTVASVPPSSFGKQQFPKAGIQSSSAPVKMEPPKPAIQQTSNERQQPDTKINLARRCVAGLKNEDLCVMDDDCDTYLHFSIYRGDKFILQALLERLKRERLQHMMDEKNARQETPLYVAVYNNQPEMVRLLIQQNVDVNVSAQVTSGEQRKFQRAIHLAASHGIEYLATLNELLKAPDIKLDGPNSEGKTALHCAILAHLRPSHKGNERINSIPIVHTLMKAGADPNAQDINSGNGTSGGKTPLMYAVETKDVNLVQRMVELIDPVCMPKYLRTSTYNGFTVLRILESLRQNFEQEETWLYIRNLFYRTERH